MTWKNFFIGWAFKIGSLEIVRGMQNVRLQKNSAGNAHARRCEKLASVPVYVLNLDRRPDRLATISRTFNESASPWLYQQACRVSALDGHALGHRANSDVITQDALDASFHARSGGMLSGPIVSVTIGHARAWEYVARQSSPWAIVMEDDIWWLHPGLDDFLCTFEEKLRDEKWKKINIEPCGPPDQDHPAGVDPLQLVKNYSWSMSMYIISKEAAREAVEHTFPIDRTHRVIDHPVAVQKRGWWNYEFYTNPRGALQKGRLHDTDISMKPTGDLNGHPIKDCAALEPANMIRPGLLQPTFFH